MKKLLIKRILPVTLFILLGFNITANTIDSLFLSVENAPDTSLSRIYLKLSQEYIRRNLDSALTYADQACNYAKKYNNKESLAYVFAQQGVLNGRAGNLDKSIVLLKKANALFRELNNMKEIIMSQNNLGAMLLEKAKYSEASQVLFDALQLSEQNQIEDKLGMIYTNIGLLFYYQEEWQKAIDYYRLSIPYKIKGDNLRGAALNYNNIGIAYYYLEVYDSVLYNFKKSLKLYEELGDKFGQARPLFNIGEIYFIKNDYYNAFKYYNKSLEIEQELGKKDGAATTLVYIGKLHAQLNEFDLALENQYKGMHILEQLSSTNELKDAYNAIYSTFEMLHNSDSALKYFKLYSALKDSMYTLDKSKLIAELETVYETEKKEQTIALQEEKIHTEHLKNLTLTIILSLTFLLLLLLFWFYHIKRKSNRMLSEKNFLLDEQHRKITHSITYASFIQAAILPPLDAFKEYFPEHFVYFKPRDIVSGDFYWITKLGNKVIVAVADCTGHGVPGAFMSMLGMAYLNEIVNVNKETQPDLILNTLREKIIQALHLEKRLSDTHDGMDISLCSIDTVTNKIEFSSAFQSMYIISDGQLKEIMPDKMPIGFHKKRKTPFSLNSIHLSKGDMIYMFTDGFADQFGGPERKKFLRSRFKDLIDKNSVKPFKEQKEDLEYIFNQWRQNQEQIDDITIVGIKI